MSEDNVVNMPEGPEPDDDLGVCPFLAAGAIAASSPADGEQMPAVRCIGAACQLWYEAQFVDETGQATETVGNCQLSWGAEWARRSFDSQQRMMAEMIHNQRRVVPAQGPVPRREGGA